ncbi:hypothetical protein H1R20_g13202, partial [Candolleomyces eurysporus]
MLFHPEYIRSQAKKRFEKHMEKAFNRVSTLISTLTNVRDYTIEGDESQNYHAGLFLSFLQPALQRWNGTLILSIDVPLDLLNSFVTVKLPHLSDIHICLSSAFLDPQAFSRFVQKHAATLKSLSLKTARCAMHSGRVAPECINWIQTILSSIRAQTVGGGGGGSRLPELQHVAVALRLLKALLHVISDFLAAHSTTLKSITLMDRALDLPDVCAVLPAFSTIGGSGLAQFVSMPLRSLEMRIDALSPNFLSLMARRLPYLQSLKLDLVDRTQMSGYARNSVCYPFLHRFVQDLNALGFDGSGWDLGRLAMSPGADRSWIAAFEEILVPRVPGLDSIEELTP